MDINENMNNMKIINIFVGWFNKIFKKNNRLSKYRMSICKECEFNVKFLKEDICTQCGCFLDAKTRVRKEKCVENKW